MLNTDYASNNDPLDGRGALLLTLKMQFIQKFDGPMTSSHCPKGQDEVPSIVKTVFLARFFFNENFVKKTRINQPFFLFYFFFYLYFNFMSK